MFFGATTFGNRTFGNQATASVDVTPTGIGVTATEGALIFTGDVTTFPTGIGITIAQASAVLPNVNVFPTGIQINSTFNNSGVVADVGVTAFPAGVILNMVTALKPKNKKKYHKKYKKKLLNLQLLLIN